MSLRYQRLAAQVGKPTKKGGLRKATWSEPSPTPRFPRPKGGNPPKTSLTGGLGVGLRRLF